MTQPKLRDWRIIRLLKQVEGDLTLSEQRPLRELESENIQPNKPQAHAMLDVESLEVVAPGGR